MTLGALSAEGISEVFERVTNVSGLRTIVTCLSSSAKICLGVPAIGQFRTHPKLQRARQLPESAEDDSVSLVWPKKMFGSVFFGRSVHDPKCGYHVFAAAPLSGEAQIGLRAAPLVRKLRDVRELIPQGVDTGSSSLTGESQRVK